MCGYYHRYEDHHHPRNVFKGEMCFDNTPAIPLSEEYKEIAVISQSFTVSKNGRAEVPTIGTYPSTFFRGLVNIYRKYHPHASDLAALKRREDELEHQRVTFASECEGAKNDLRSKNETVQTEIQKIPEERNGIVQERAQLEVQKRQLKERLQRVAVREQRAATRQCLEDVARDIREAALQLLDACDTADNDHVSEMISRMLEKLPHHTPPTGSTASAAGNYIPVAQPVSFAHGSDIQ